jgi:LuxR family maltose regulon positive regulatory protein
MSTPIINTKLYVPPPRSGVILRPNLIERLNEGLSANRKLTLISAPAGFGKTTMVSEWVAGCKRMVAWLSLDEGDNDPTGFLTYFIAALQTVAPKFGEGILGLLQSQPSQMPLTESILATLLNEIANIPHNFVLVLDDYHVLDAKPVDDALTFILEHLPPQMHVVIITREDPSLPLARWRVRGGLNELRAADLRFTPAEAAEFLNRVMGLNLSAEDTAALETRTEGWIAGLQLAALSIHGREDVSSFIQDFTGSNHFVLDYLGEEVLQHQSEHIRSFLQQTAIFERFCVSLCNAVNERKDSKEMLDFLELNNLFLIPLDDKRQWYRYHHLFAEVLRAHLLEERPEQVSRLHRRASEWYEQNRLAPNAISHALAAKDFERAARLIELAGPATEEGTIQPDKWLGWVKTLPEALVHARPVLNVWYAFLLLGRGDMEGAEARLTDAEQWLEPSDIIKVQLETSLVGMVVADQEQFRSLPAAIAVGRAYIAQASGNIPDTVRYARRVLELVPEGDHVRHGQASMLLGLTYWASGDLEAANRVFGDYTLKLRKAGNIPDAISTTVVGAEIRLALGRLHEGISAIEHLLRFVLEQGEPISPDTADLHRGLGELYFEQGNLEGAWQHLQRSKELGEKAELPVWRYRWRVAQARLNETQGDPDGALALLDEAERLFIRTPLPEVRPISALKARIWVTLGKLTNALEWVRQQGLSPDNDIGYLHEFEYITLTRILIAQYQNDQTDGSIQAVMRLLYRLLQAAERGSRMGSVIEILVLQALAHQAQGKLTPALVPLERALTLAEPEGYVRVFVDEGQPMAELLTRIEAKGGTLHLRKYIHKLLSAFDEQKEIILSGSTMSSLAVGKKRSLPLAKQAVSLQPLIELLSERELEVLRLLRTDLSGPEIARECMVSLSTVRTHTQNIYAKLGVNNRRAAVRRAEGLDLL